MNNEVVIIGKGKGPAKYLSNFYPNQFVFRGIPCGGMEGFLQGLKFRVPEVQRKVFGLVGWEAKARGRKVDWRPTQTLWFQGHPIKRSSPVYQELLNEAYDAMYVQNESFRKALAATGNSTITHPIGCTIETETVLTRDEFCGRLMRLRTGEHLCKVPVSFSEYVQTSLFGNV